MTTMTSKDKNYIAAKKFLGDDVRKIFDSLESALKTLRSIYAGESFPSSFPIVAAGVGLLDMGAEDTIPPFDSWDADAKAAYMTEGVRVTVAFIGVRNLDDPTDSTKKINGARGFVVFPMPSLSVIRSIESGEAWLTKVAEKEASHVALRGLRGLPDGVGADMLASAAMSMPLSVEDYVEGSTAESIDTAAFDGLWKTFRKMLSESTDTASLVPALPPKAEVIKCVRSSAYAAENFGDLEDMGVFTFIAESMAGVIDYLRNAADEKGEEYPLDSSEIRAWAAGRDTFVFQSKAKPVANLAAVNLRGFAEKLAAPAKPATEGATA